VYVIRVDTDRECEYERDRGQARSARSWRVQFWPSAVLGCPPRPFEMRGRHLNPYRGEAEVEG